MEVVDGGGLVWVVLCGCRCVLIAVGHGRRWLGVVAGIGDKGVVVVVDVNEVVVGGGSGSGGCLL